MSFRAKMRLFFAAVVIVPLIAIGVVVLTLQEQSRHAEANARLSESLAEFRELYLVARTEAEDEARFAVADPVLRRALERSDAATARARLRRLLRGDPDLVSAALFDRGHRRLARVGSGQGFAHFSVGLRAPDGSTLGTVSVSVTEAGGLVRRIGSGGDVELLALRDDRVLASTIPGVEGKNLAPSSEEELRAPDGERYRALRVPVGTVGGAPEHIASLQRSSALQADISEDRLLIGGALIVFFTVALTAALLVARELRHQVGTFLGAAQRLAAGHLDERVPIGGEDYFGRLAREFNRMAGQLQVKIDELSRNSSELEEALRQATTDELTGLANVREMQRVLDAELARLERSGGSLGLVMLDLDDFKQINDVHGHPQGDEVLRAVGRVLRRLCRDIDTPARQGGEELVVVLPETDLAGAERFAERARAEIAALSFPIEGGGSIGITASFGASAAPLVAAERERLVTATDEALYRAKRGGKNRVERAA